MAADANVVITHITTSGVIVYLIQWLKKSRYFPWITAERTKLLRILAMLGAAVGAVGIHYTWNPQAHSLTIEGLSLVGILTLAAAWLKSFVTQEIIYQSAAKNGYGELLQQILKLLTQPAAAVPQIAMMKAPAVAAPEPAPAGTK